jgi:hypothetical protein
MIPQNRVYKTHGKDKRWIVQNIPLCGISPISRGIQRQRSPRPSRTKNNVNQPCWRPKLVSTRSGRIPEFGVILAVLVSFAYPVPEFGYGVFFYVRIIFNDKFCEGTHGFTREGEGRLFLCAPVNKIKTSLLNKSVLVAL